MVEYSALNLVGRYARCPWCSETVKVVKNSTGVNAALPMHAGSDDLLCPMSWAILKVSVERSANE